MFTFKIQHQASRVKNPVSRIQHPVSSVKRILIFSFSHIGDAVLSTAVLSPLQKRFPDARISILVGPKVGEVFRGDVRFSELIIYDNHGLHAGLGGKLRLIRELNARKFDLSIDLRDSFWSHLTGGVHWGIPLSQRFTSRYRESHAVDRYLCILRARGLESENAAPKIHLSSEKQWADDFLSRNGVTARDMVIGIHPGGGWPYKLWPTKRFAALGDLLSQKYDARVLVFAGPDEASLQDEVVNSMKSSPILVKDVGLREMAALIQRCYLYVGNDTGPMHIAAAVGTRVVAIFGPTDASRSGPYGNGHIVIARTVGCNPCHPGSRPGGCKRGNCLAMEAVSLEQVAEAVERILNDGRERTRR
jgi:heptosyltransferase-2